MKPMKPPSKVKEWVKGALIFVGVWILLAGGALSKLNMLDPHLIPKTTKGWLLLVGLGPVAVLIWSMIAGWLTNMDRGGFIFFLLVAVVVLCLVGIVLLA